LDLQKTALSTGSDKLDEDFTVARLYVNKMKSEVKLLQTRCTQLDTATTEGARKLDVIERELSDSRLMSQQHEAKLKTVGETLKEVDAKKRVLEERVDRLVDDCARLNAQG